MKNFIKQIIREALKDELPDYMINAVKKNNPNLADKFLSMDVPKHTKVIPNLKIEIDEPKIAQNFISDIQFSFSTTIIEQFEKTKLVEILNMSSKIIPLLEKALSKKMDYLYSQDLKTIYSNASLSKTNDLKNVIKELSFLYSKNFPLLQGKDNNFRNPIFTKNKSNIFTFIKSFNTAFPEDRVDLNSIITDKIFQGLREPILNFDENVNDLVNSKLYLYITDKPADILRMSVSNFYSSCQNMYSGVQNEQLLANVFDENSKIAYLIFDTPYVDNQGNKHPFTPIARTIIRVDENNHILFDKSYPSQLEKDFYNILKKYADLRNQGSEFSVYKYKHIGLPKPYMDRYKMKTDYSSTEQNLENEPRALALADFLNIDVNNLIQEADVVFVYYRMRYAVYTKNEANEYAKDYLIDNWVEYYGTVLKVYDLIMAGVLDKARTYDVLDISNSYLYHEGLTLQQYLINNNLEYVSDFNEFLKDENFDNWFRDGVTFNIYNLINYLNRTRGGIGEVRQYAIQGDINLKSEINKNGYYIYKLK